MRHYIVRWKHPDKGWLVSTNGPATKAEAARQFASDVDYFYDDIDIELVRVTETTVKKMRGSHSRRQRAANE